MIDYNFTGFEINSMVYEIELSTLDTIPKRWVVKPKPQKVKYMIIDALINYVLEGDEPSLKDPTVLFEDMESAVLECQLRNKNLSPELKIAEE